MIMRLFILMLLVAYSVAAAADAEVYRWIDDDGQAHYSDRPHEGAELVTLTDAQTFSAPAAQQEQSESTSGTDDATDGADEEAQSFSYKSVKIVSPTQSQVLWSTGGLLKVSVSLQPSLRRGDTLMVYLDGKMVEGLTGNQREVSLTDVFRGEHTLRTEVRDGGGGVVTSGDSITFTVKQTSTQNPSRPGRGL